MSEFQHPSSFEASLKALKTDLLRDDGPQISTVRNYNFAILPYPPADEFPVRRAIRSLTEELRAGGWTVGDIPLHQLLIKRLRAQGIEVVDALIDREKRLMRSADPGRVYRELYDGWLRAAVLALEQGDAAAAYRLYNGMVAAAQQHGGAATPVFGPA